MDANLEDWRGRAYSFFSHKTCEFFPCHATEQPDDFNCLFCFCPLYHSDCGGNAVFTESGVKDCSHCLFPHRRDSYGRILDKLGME